MMINNIYIQNKARARILVVMLCNQQLCQDKAYQSGNMGVGDTARVYVWVGVRAFSSDVALS